jgi:hypothetical protein
MENFCVVLNECGFAEALYGLGLSYGITSSVPFEQFSGGNEEFSKMVEVAKKLAHRDTGENKFLESMQVWILIRAPRYWWSQFDTYRAGVTKQSESTMHTLMSSPLTTDEFEHGDISPAYLAEINSIIATKNKKKIEEAKRKLPEGFMQQRVVCTNYKVIRHMYNQRKNHRLGVWKDIFGALSRQLQYWEFIGGKKSE